MDQNGSTNEDLGMESSSSQERVTEERKMDIEQGVTGAGSDEPIAPKTRER